MNDDGDERWLVDDDTGTTKMLKNVHQATTVHYIYLHVGFSPLKLNV